uniref:Uncharacterized protein n=1 Tax=Arundo donax TaxID=35708 RepID=A0A0A9H4G9_ARUDO
MEEYLSIYRTLLCRFMVAPTEHNLQQLLLLLPTTCFCCYCFTAGKT